MGLGGISIWQLLIVLVIVLLLFGTKKLRGIGSDLGGAVKGFKDSMSKDEDQDETSASTQESAAIDEDTQSAETKTEQEKQSSH